MIVSDTGKSSLAHLWTIIHLVHLLASWKWVCSSLLWGIYS